MTIVSRSFRNLGDLSSLSESFLTGDALASFQFDISGKLGFELLINDDFLKSKDRDALERTSMLSPTRHTHVRRIMHDPSRRITVMSAYKNASKNPLMAKLMAKIDALAFKDGLVRNDSLKRRTLTLAGRTGKTVAFATVGHSLATEINLPGGWAHAEFAATKDDLYAFLPIGKDVKVASFGQIEEALLAGGRVIWDTAYVSEMPIAWMSEIGDGLVIGFYGRSNADAVGQLMSAQGFMPVRGARGPAKLTPKTSAIASGGEKATALEGLLMSPDGKDLELVFRPISEKDNEATLPFTVPFKQGEDWRAIVETLNALPQ